MGDDDPLEELAKRAAAGDSAALSRLVEEMQNRSTGWRCASSATPRRPRTRRKRSSCA
jgi:hypothetical protein